MFALGLMLGVVACAIQALRSARLLLSAIWLASASALVSVVLYMLGAHEVAVIELSVSAGLVTVLLVYAIVVAGDEDATRSATPPWPLALGLAVGAALLLGWLALPLIGIPGAAAVSSFKQMLWQHRSPDLLAQLVLLFIGAIGVLWLLAERQPAVDERPVGVAAPAALLQKEDLEEPAGSRSLQPRALQSISEPETAPEEVEV
jgi:uncharacterized MnhB-related membrane protein